MALFHLKSINMNPNNNKQQSSKSEEKEVQTSIPRNDRPEGPFEHSGEVAHWTEAEEREVQQQKEEEE